MNEIDKKTKETNRQTNETRERFDEWMVCDPQDGKLPPKKRDLGLARLSTFPLVSNNRHSAISTLNTGFKPSGWYLSKGITLSQSWADRFT